MNFRCRIPLAVAIAFSAAGCGDDATGPNSDGFTTPPNVRAWVSGNAAARLDANGRFVFPEPAAPGPTPIITRAEAGELGVGFIRSFFANPHATGNTKGIVEADHGGPIAWSDVRLDDRIAYYAESPYEPLPENIPLRTRRYFGPHYLLPMRTGRERVVSVSVAAHCLDTSLDANGFISRPPISGSEFGIAGIPKTLGAGIPLWPEEAVYEVFTATGAKTTELPRLIQPGERWVFQGARWELVLDREIRVEVAGTGTERSTGTIYIGVWGRETSSGERETAVIWYLPRAVQPVEETIRYTIVDEVDFTSENFTYTARFRTDVPVLFDVVTPVGH